MVHLENNTGRILAIYPGDSRIGIAISDEKRNFARPLMILKHQSRLYDAGMIAEIAKEQGAGLIIVGCPTDSEGGIGPAGRKAKRLADAIRIQTIVQVLLWDESFSTIDASAEAAKLNMKRKSGEPLDHLAATMILRSYLEHLSQDNK